MDGDGAPALVTGDFNFDAQAAAVEGQAGEGRLVRAA